MNIMITSLTDAQRAKCTEYVQRWTEIGLNCEPVDVPRATRAVALAYQAARLDPPPRIVVADGPISGAILASMLRERKSVWASVGASVWASVWASVGASVGDSVGASVRDSVWASVGASVGDSVGASVGDSVWDSVWDSVGASVNHMAYGAHDAHWLAFSEYMRSELGLRKEVEPLSGLIELAHCCGWWAPYRGVAILQHRHSELHRDSAGRLHHDGGMAVKYRDGWGFWALNGVRVPQWLAETRAEQLDPLKILAEQNAEIRREGVRKVGVERLVHVTKSERVDAAGSYELLRVPIGNDRAATALKMLNPSVPECWHVEFVDDSCRTVQEALNFRNHLSANQVDDVNGVDWYQQGDVILRPKGATKFKSQPKVLT